MCCNYCNGRLQYNTAKPFTNIAHLLSEADVDSYFPTVVHTCQKAHGTWIFLMRTNVGGSFLLKERRHTHCTLPAVQVKQVLVPGCRGVWLRGASEFQKAANTDSLCWNTLVRVKCVQILWNVAVHPFAHLKTPNLLSWHIQVQLVSHMGGKGSGSVQISSSSWMNC